MSTHQAIEVGDLRLSCGTREVIHGLSFAVERHEILAVIGPAQSGKTSLLRCINRTIEFVSGTTVSGNLRVFGQEVRSVKNVYELRRQMTLVLVTSLTQQAGRLADRTLFLYNGEKVELDRNEVVFSEQPGDRRTYDYVNGIFG